MYLGLELENPIVVAASGITGSVDGARRCADAGAGAVVLKSMFEELIERDLAGVEAELLQGTHPEVLDYLRADVGKRVGALPYLEFIENVRQSVDVPVIASINCTSGNWWVPYGRRVESAGADALELNISHFPESRGESPRDIEKRYGEIVGEVSQSLSIPVAVKIGFYFTSLWSVMEDLVAAGAKGLVLFNRYYAVDVDLDTRSFVAAVGLSSPSEMNLPLRWIGLSANKLSCDLAGSTGVHDRDGVVRMLLAGATVVQVCSALYRNGPEYLAELRAGLASWLDDEGFRSVAEIRGLARRNADADESLLTRLQYVKALEEASSFYKF
jgi:dihydroorotate dehydrogenase (fumarate)